MTITYLKQLEEKALELGVDPLSLYSEALINFIDKHEATEDEVKQVIEVLKRSPNKTEYCGRTFITKVKSLDFGELSEDKLNSILKQLGYKNNRIGKGVALSVPLP